MTEKTAVTPTPTQAPATREETRYTTPPVDIFETDKGLTVVADLPGVAKNGVHVGVEDGILTIEGRVATATQGDSMLTEFDLTDYHRQFELSDEMDVEHIAAEIKHGVLTLTLPRSEAAQPRRIDVKVK